MINLVRFPISLGRPEKRLFDACERLRGALAIAAERLSGSMALEKA